MIRLPADKSWKTKWKGPRMRKSGSQLRSSKKFQKVRRLWTLEFLETGKEHLKGKIRPKKLQIRRLRKFRDKLQMPYHLQAKPKVILRIKTSRIDDVIPCFCFKNILSIKNFRNIIKVKKYQFQTDLTLLDKAEFMHLKAKTFEPISWFFLCLVWFLTNMSFSILDLRIFLRILWAIWLVS